MTNLQVWGDLFFDVFSTSLSFVDLISDVFVSIQFYQEGEYVYFWVSMCIFFIAQCAYVTQFETQFSGLFDGMCKRAIRCVLVFPFAQLVPVVVWLAAAEKEWFLRLLKRFGLNAHQPALSNNAADPLQQYFSKKWREHWGFIIEAVVEAVPQSLLQMAYIVTRGKATPLNVFSIASSLLTVCSKGFLFTFSIYPLMVLFSACCFCADVTGVFATVSFLTMPSAAPSSTTYSLFGIETSNLASYLWMVKELTLFFAMGCLGLFIWVVLWAERLHGSGSSTWSWKQIVEMLVLLAGGIVFFVPAAIFLEGLKLFSIPLVIFGAQLKSQREAPIAARAVWNFMRGTSVLRDEETQSLLQPPQGWFDLPDFERKIRALNLVAAQECLVACGGECENKNRRSFWISEGCIKAMQIRRSCLQKNGDHGGQAGVNYLWHQYKHLILTDIDIARRQQDTKRWCGAFGVVVVFGFLVPVYVLGNIYCLFYPIICMLTLEMGLLQKVFGGMYMFFLLAIFFTGCLSCNFLHFLLRMRFAVTSEVQFFSRISSTALSPVFATYCVWRRQEVYHYLHSQDYAEAKQLPMDSFSSTIVGGIVNRFRKSQNKKSSPFDQCLLAGPMFPREVALLVVEYLVTQAAVYHVPLPRPKSPSGAEAFCQEPAPLLKIEC